MVHYPLVFRNLIIELPEKTLHVKTFAPVVRPEVYLKDLTAVQGDTARATAWSTGWMRRSFYGKSRA